MPRRPIGTITTGEGKRYSFKMLSPKASKTVLRPYSVQLGQLATAWNWLHHNLSSLFWLILRARNEHFAQVIWHSTDSDFVQRKMLRAIIEMDQKSMPIQRRLKPDQAKAIIYILNEIDNNLRHKRNNAVHAPLMVLTGVRDDGVKSWVEAHFNPLNPRAKPLRDKDLIQEFKDYTAHAEMLNRYAVQIWNALNYPGRFPWPDKPPVPQAHKKKQKIRRARARPPPRPPEASRA